MHAVLTHAIPDGRLPPFPGSQGWAKKDGQILTDEFGRPAPNVDMYPSAAGGKGLKPLADALRGRGLQLGLWYMRGVPRSAAAARMPILGCARGGSVTGQLPGDML